ncbi:MAG: 4Fe-4S binding protein [Gammaproteobacteria bacterium]
MNNDKVLEKIPVVVEGQHSPGRNLHIKRRAFQLGVILVATLIPIIGLFRIDIPGGSMIVLDRQIWFSDFFIVFGFWLAIASGLVLTYSALGTAFCGWACPQNTLSEWANNLTRKWLGKNAEVELHGHAMRVSAGKRKIGNWVVLLVLFFIAAMASALIPMLYFFPPEAIWSFVTFQADDRLAGSLHYIYSVFAAMIFVNITFIRHFMCRFMCVYRVWQHSFKTKQSLHIEHDRSHMDECNKCNYCMSACIVKIDPRNTETYDACINCGECVNACSEIRASRKTGGSLLHFLIGQRDKSAQSTSLNLDTLFSRTKWSIPVTVVGLAMFAWGLWSYEPYHFAVYQNETEHKGQILDYRIALARKVYHPGKVDLVIDGIPEGSYHVSSQEMSFSTAERVNVILSIDNTLPKGIYPFIVHASSDDGWQDSFRVHHVVTKG